MLALHVNRECVAQTVEPSDSDGWRGAAFRTMALQCGGRRPRHRLSRRAGRRGLVRGARRGGAVQLGTGSRAWGARAGLDGSPNRESVTCCTPSSAFRAILHLESRRHYLIARTLPRLRFQVVVGLAFSARPLRTCSAQTVLSHRKAGRMARRRWSPHLAVLMQAPPSVPLRERAYRWHRLGGRSRARRRPRSRFWCLMGPAFACCDTTIRHIRGRARHVACNP